MCHATEYSQYNLGGCVNLLLSWAYHHIPLLRLDGFETRRFPLVKRWIEYHPDNAKGENRLRHYRLTLNGISILNMLYADQQLQGVVPPRIAEFETSAVVVVRQFGGLQHIPTRPLNIDEMYRHDGKFGRGESTIVLLIFSLTAPLNGLSSTVSADDLHPPNSTRNTNNSKR
ncbi:hypothetical protein Ahy_B02g060583 [Arachis hypogaea]|uniref:Aminotransferase-like plant mobile domain-containing protein n=1 Tax=Arachis hypogaea TaxID=3818 RepID=A0A445AIZ0_ARAHY|nr:hypothetical protein Ahy_B02g060583 [Arachis hypogaea]